MEVEEHLPQDVDYGVEELREKVCNGVEYVYSSYRVESSFRERVTAEHPPGPHEDAPQQTVLLDGLQRV